MSDTENNDPEGTLSDIDDSGEFSKQDFSFDQSNMSIEDEIALVERQMREYERCAQYLEAERERKRLKTLKADVGLVKKRQLKRHQQDDYRAFHDLATSHQAEFDAAWSERLDEHTLRTQYQHDQLQTRHESQLLELRDKLESKVRVPRFSSVLLSMRKKQYLLGKTKRYLEAENIKRTGDILEAEEMHVHHGKVQTENQRALDKLLEQHLIEMRALRQKMELERKSLLEQRNQQQEKLQFRLRKIAVELNKSHKRQQLVSSGHFTSSLGTEPSISSRITQLALVEDAPYSPRRGSSSSSADFSASMRPRLKAPTATGQKKKTPKKKKSSSKSSSLRSSNGSAPEGHKPRSRSQNSTLHSKKSKSPQAQHPYSRRLTSPKKKSSSLRSDRALWT